MRLNLITSRLTPSVDCNRLKPCLDHKRLVCAFHRRDWPPWEWTKRLESLCFVQPLEEKYQLSIFSENRKESLGLNLITHDFGFWKFCWFCLNFFTMFSRKDLNKLGLYFENTGIRNQGNKLVSIRLIFKNQQPTLNYHTWCIALHTHTHKAQAPLRCGKTQKKHTKLQQAAGFQEIWSLQSFSTKIRKEPQHQVQIRQRNPILLNGTASKKTPFLYTSHIGMKLRWISSKQRENWKRRVVSFEETNEETNRKNQKHRWEKGRRKLTEKLAVIGEIVVILWLRDWWGDDHQNDEAHDCYKPSVNGPFTHFGPKSEVVSFFSSSTLRLLSTPQLNLEYTDGSFSPLSTRGSLGR